MLSLTESLFCLAGILKVTDENCQDLLEASNMLQLSGALSFCCAFLKNQMHTSNCIGKTFFFPGNVLSCPLYFKSSRHIAKIS